jgi:mycothiol synthase
VPAIEPTATLTDDDVGAVEALLASAAAVDGFSAMNEAAQLSLRHHHRDLAHLLVRDNAHLVGYAQLELGGQRATGQLVVAPGWRRRGTGTAMLRALLELAPSGLRVWAVGDTPAARAVADRVGLRPVRTLLVMTRSLTGDIPAVGLPPGTTMRTFVVGRDEDEWLAVNARAFASHPEQGAVDRTDLAERMQEPWFDPAGLLLAVRGERLVGYHWTKEHPGGLGEVYVLGVDPLVGGQGIGKALLVAGLRLLQARGNTSVQLYVEADHGPAVSLYTKAGFSVTKRDVMYADFVATGSSSVV